VNILITDDGHPQLADFGLSIMSEGTEAHMTATLTDAGTSAWMSPQRIEGHQRRRSTADDVYAYGCLAYFVRSSHLPIAERKLTYSM
jgi:serine/threonine protein kinase